MKTIKRVGLGWGSGVMTMCFGLRLQEYMGCDSVVRAPDGHAVMMNAFMMVGLFVYAVSRERRSAWTA